MSYKLLVLALAAIGGTALADPAAAQANEQFLPMLVLPDRARMRRMACRSRTALSTTAT